MSTLRLSSKTMCLSLSWTDLYYELVLFICTKNWVSSVPSALSRSHKGRTSQRQQNVHEVDFDGLQKELELSSWFSDEIARPVAIPRQFETFSILAIAFHLALKSCLTSVRFCMMINHSVHAEKESWLPILKKSGELYWETVAGLLFASFREMHKHRYPTRTKAHQIETHQCFLW